MKQNEDKNVKQPALFFSDVFKVRAYEAGPDGRVNIQSLCNYLQDAASSHAFLMGVAVDRLQKDNLTWVLSRLHVRIERYPYWMDKIRIDTWPADKDKYYGIRDFRMFDGKNRQVGVASSSWMMIDTVQRRSVALPDFMDSLQDKEAGRSLDDPFTQLPKVEQIDNEKFFNVRIADLDMNRHVNSVHYLSWALETVPPEIWKNFRLSDVEINYRNESYYGDRICSQSEARENGDSVVFIHQLFQEKERRELTRLRTSWQRK